MYKSGKYYKRLGIPDGSVFPTGSLGDVFFHTLSGCAFIHYSGQWNAIGSASSFLSLIDTPTSYAGEANKVVAVTASEDGLEFVVSSGTNSKIKLYAVDGTLTTYDPTDAGLDLASAAAVTGDTIILAPGTYSSEHALASGVSYAGRAQKEIKFTDSITIPAGVVLENIQMHQILNTVHAVRGIDCTVILGQEKSILKDCIIRVINSGVGDLLGVALNNTGDLDLYDCYVYSSGFGNCHAVGNYGGNLIMYGGEAFGSTSPFPTA